MVRKITFTATLLVLLLALVPASLLYYLGYTESGLQFIVAKLPARLGPMTLRAAGATGTLAGGMTLEHFELEHELVSLRVEKVAGHVRMLPLLCPPPPENPRLLLPPPPPPPPPPRPPLWPPPP